MAGPALSACPYCGAEQQPGNFCTSCGGALAPAASVPQPPTPPDPRPKAPTWRILLIIGAAVLALVLVAVFGVVAAGMVFGDEQRAQDQVLDELGPPSRFILAYMPRVEGGAEEIVRTEFWYYPDHRQRIAFVEGMIASVEEIEAEPADAVYLDVSPQEFDFVMGYEDVVAALGEKAEKVEEIPDLEARDGLEMYVTDHAMFAIERGNLVYLQTIGRTGSGGSTTKAGEPDDAVAGRLYPVFVGQSWGYIDRGGDIVVQPRFAAAEAMSEGLAVVVDGKGLYGFVDSTGKVAIQPRFKMAFGFHEGLAAAASDGELFGFIDTSGKWVVKPVYQYVGDFGDGLAPFSDGEKWGYVDRGGKVAIPPRYAAADTFSDGMAAVDVGGKFAYIDTKGRTVIGPTLTSAGRFVDGLAPASSGDRIGFVDWKGAFVIEQSYLNGEPFSEGLAEVATDEGVGFIDVSGSWVIKPVFEDAGPFQGGIAAVWEDGKIGYIDRSGTSVWEPGAGQ